MKTPTRRIVPLLVLTLLAGPASAGIVGVQLGSFAPPSHLGSFAVTAFTADSAEIGALVTTVALPADSVTPGVLLFDVPLEHRKVGDGWATWSGGYTGDVYLYDVYLGAGPGGTDELTITLHSGTRAFYFYLEPNYFSDFSFDLQAFTDVVGEEFLFSGVSIMGNGGAQGFGFYVTGDPLSSLTSVTVRGFDTWPDGFALGRFGIHGEPQGPNVPDGAFTLRLLGGSLCLIALLRRRFGR